jgi:hypothetical protein
MKGFLNSFEESKACAIFPLDSLAHFGCWDSGTLDAKVSCSHKNLILSIFLVQRANSSN